MAKKLAICIVKSHAMKWIAAGVLCGGRESPYGSAFERNSDGELVEIED